MGVRNKITDKGFVTENKSGSSDFQVKVFNNNPKSLLKANSNGVVSSDQLSEHVRFEF